MVVTWYGFGMVMLLCWVWFRHGFGVVLVRLWHSRQLAPFSHFAATNEHQ